MKKIRPVARYDEDQQYPSMAEIDAEIDAEGEGGSGRRSFLVKMLAGAATLGTGLWLGGEARAQPRHRPNPPPPGVPPRPDRRRRPCTPPLATVILAEDISLCPGRYGRVSVTTADPEVALLLRRPREARRLGVVARPILKQEKSCSWADEPRRIADMEERLARAFTGHYQQVTGGELEPLKVRLAVKAPERRPGGVLRRPKFPPPPRRRGCASCATDASPEDGLLPTGLVTLLLLWLKGR